MPVSAAQTALPVSSAPLASEAAQFYAILFHDDRKSNAVVATRRGSLWAEESLPCSQLGYLRSTFIDTNDHYVSVNSFAGKRRDTAKCRQVNAIMFDVDAHKGSHTSIVSALRQRLDSAIGAGTIPAPNIVVDSGRGLQVYYVLEKSIPYRLKDGQVNSKVLDFMADVRRKLAVLMERELVAHVPGSELDTSVFDIVRVARIPGSFNSTAARRAKLISTSPSFHNLAGLNEFCKQNIVSVQNEKPHKGKSARIYKFDRLQMMRMTKVEELVAYREAHGGCQGTRDLCLFVYYNAATQVLGPQEALHRTHQLNNKLREPLPAQDIEQIAKTVDEVTIKHGAHKGKAGFYPLSKESIIAKLQLEAQEITSIDFFASKRQTARQAAKIATKTKRETRNQQICKLYGSGWSQTQIAKEIGCSIGTVSTVTRAANIQRGSIKKTIKLQFKAALKTKQSNLINRQVSFSWHTSWGCDAPVLDFPFHTQFCFVAYPFMLRFPLRE